MSKVLVLDTLIGTKVYVGDVDYIFDDNEKYMEVYSVDEQDRLLVNITDDNGEFVCKDKVDYSLYKHAADNGWRTAR